MALLPPDPVYKMKNKDGEPVHSLAFAILPGGSEFLLVGSGSGNVHMFNLQTNRFFRKISCGDSPILHIVHTDTHFIHQDKNGTIKVNTILQTGDYECLCKINIDCPTFCRIDMNMNLETLYVPDKDSKVQIYNFDGEKLGSLEPDDNDKLGSPMCLKFVEYPCDRPFLLVGYEAGNLLLWDLNTSHCISKLKVKECPTSVDFHLGQGKGIITNVSEVIQIFYIDKKTFELVIKQDVTITNPGVNRVHSRIDGKVFATAGWDGHVRIFSWLSLRPLAVLTEHHAAVQDVVYSTETISQWKAPIMAAGGLDGFITLWDLYNNKQK